MKNVFLISLLLFSSVLFAQDYSWTVTKDGIYRDGSLFYLKGQSWAKQTPITYNTGTSSEAALKKTLSELSAIGVNTLRVYGSPNDSDWDGSSNFANLIKWIDEWNVDNHDGGDPNKAMYYLVQINPADDESTISDKLPFNTIASFYRAIHDTSNPESLASLVSVVDDVTGGSQYLLGYMIYHELNGSNKYIDWRDTVGASGIEDFMNAAADALHTTYAPNKLVTHTGDAKQPADDIYEQIENLDNNNGNVFANFDLIGFNLYISTTQMLSEGVYYDRIPQRRGFSVNDNRGWYIGETGASSDVGASTGIPAVNYTQSQGIANLQIMWQKSKELGGLIGFMLFTVQDNDLGAIISDDIKQRGYFDVYGDKKFLYYAYPDVINEISTNERYHFTDDHGVGITVVDGGADYTITFDFENKTSSNKDFFWSIYGDDNSTSQRFNRLVDEAYSNISANSSTTIVRVVPKPSSNDLFAVEAVVIDDLTPKNPYSYGRNHILSDAIGTVAGLNLNTGNSPKRPSDPGAPENLSASGLSDSQINLTWDSNAESDEYIVIEQSVNGVDGWVELVTLSGDTVNYSDYGLIASKTYYYRAYTINKTGNSGYSSIARATTKSRSLTVIVNPIEDAYVRNGNDDDNNFGSSDDLIIKQGTDPNYFRKTYIQFDISGEAFTDVTSAIVRLYANSLKAAEVTTYEADDNWQEESVSWNNTPPQGDELDVVAVSSENQYYEWDVTSYVAGQALGDGVVSLIFYDASASNALLSFNSKEIGSNIPELVITGKSTINN
jgi:hypothetical protein